jgi:acyl transferase domain-containing protein/aryl carrier-like protein
MREDTGHEIHTPRHDPIAIIGIGCRFPGGANGPEEFWKLLTEGVDAISEVPPDRWNVRAFHDPEPGTPGKTYARWGGFISDIDKFDAEFFGISPREASFMDPQQRILLETACEAIEDGGQPLEHLAGSRTGIFIGVSTNDYAQIQSTADDRTTIDTHSSTGGAGSIVSNRISYCFDLRGPSLSVDTACSSSLVAVHLACRSIWSGESTMAIAGGVNIIIIPEPFIGFGKLAMLSREGRCKAFDATGNGFVRAEGAGVVLLKPLAQALADGDPVYAVIRGTAVNQDGRTNGITVPSEQAQASMLREACTNAGIPSGAIQYIEAHGTGTAVGDPIETNALGEVLCANRPEGSLCVIGSVKTNLGHLEAGAGIAGLIKTALAIKHGLIPPNLHFDTPNPLIDFDKLKLRVQDTLGPWPHPDAPKFAGVNSFGFGGTNAHILLSDIPSETKPHIASSKHDGQAILLPFSARNEEALRDLAGSYKETVGGRTNGSPLSLTQLGYNLCFRRSHHEHRLTVVAHSHTELVELIDAFIAGEKRPGIRTGHRTTSVPKIGFVFSGQGPQWWAMGRQLLEQEPVFRGVIEECDRLMSGYSPWSLLKELTADEEHSRMDETSISQPSIFALQVALAALWKSWGVEPHAVVGHSVGEVAAAHIAGIYTLEEALRVIYHRGRCMDLASSKGRMLGAGLSFEQAKEMIRGYEDRVSIAAINSPSSVTFSGDPEALNEIHQLLEERQVFTSFLKVNYAFHSPQMEPVQDEMMRALGTLSPADATTSFFSTVTGRREEGDVFTADYWWRNVRQPVRFADAVNGMIDDGCTVFIELSAHPALSGYVGECLSAKDVQGHVVHSLRRKEDERVHMLSSLGGLYTIGYPVDWSKHYPERQPHMTLPRYPWQHESYWHESELARQARLALHVHPLLGQRTQAADPTWRVELSRTMLPYLQDHKVQGHTVFPAAGYVEMALAAAREVFATGTYIVEDVDFQRALFIPESGVPPVIQTTFYKGDSSFAISSRIANGEWTVHAVGRIRAENSSMQPVREDIDSLRQSLQHEVEGKFCYSVFNEWGLQFGPSFQGIDRLWRRDGESLGVVRPAESVQQEAAGYLIHPAALDSCFQVLSGTLELRAAGATKVYLPVHIRQVRFYNRPSATLWSHATLIRCGAHSLDVDIRILDEQGERVMDIRCFRGQSVDTNGTGPRNLDNWVYEFRWLLKPHEHARPSLRRADFVPPLAAIRKGIEEEADHIADNLGWRTRAREIEPDIDRLCAAYIIRAFRTLGWSPETGEVILRDAFVERLGIAPSHHRLTGRLLDTLALDGILERGGDGWTFREFPAEIDISALWQSILRRFPAQYPELMLTAACGERLADALQGKVDPLQLIFPEGSTTIAEHLYQDAPSFKNYNLMVAAVVSRIVERLPEGRTLRVLEIGGGTAGMTAHVIPKLPPETCEYVFTDVTAHFLHKAEQKFRDHPFMKYQMLDIEKDPVSQGFELLSFDIILASDVLHATTDLRASLRNVQKLLASGGLLVLLETDSPGRWADMVFGLTEGWWRFTDIDLRPNHPLLSRPQWLALLEELDFREAFALPQKRDDGASQAVFVARGPEVMVEHEESVQRQPAPPKRWLLFADEGGVADAIAARMRAQGDECTLVAYGEQYEQRGDGRVVIAPQRLDDFTMLLNLDTASGQLPLEGVIHCWSCDSVELEDASPASAHQSFDLTCISVMHFIQGWSSVRATHSPRLSIVTRGAQPAGRAPALSVLQSPVCGLGRVIMNEHQNLHCRMIDLSRQPTPVEVDALVDEILSPDHEDEVALRGDARYVVRLDRSSLSRSARHEKKLVRLAGTGVRLENPSPGVLENLTLCETRRRLPGESEVEIRVEAAAMNFRDVMKALGIYPVESDEDLLLGDECAGTVVAVGDGVTDVKIGDEVIAMAPGSYCSYVTIPSDLLIRKPSGMSFSEAVTIPVAFLTSYYALHYLGRILPGERVLIHAATGGVGLAAMQIARHAGAEVLATAGTPEKRAFLRSSGIEHVMDSRSLTFADEVMELTGGHGVDIVLNSLAGEAIQKGMECLAPYGRFLEIGKRDIHLNTKLGLRAFKNNISFSVVYLKSLMEDRPALVRHMMNECVGRFERAIYHSLPYRVFPFSNAMSAFRHMAQAKHIGKIVLSMQEEEVLVDPLREESFSLSADATYLITGGLGGFGVATAHWLLESGARNLVLVGRSGAATEAARSAVAALEERGARVVVAAADVTREDDLARVLTDIDKSMPPLRGVIHAAMVLDDGILVQLEPARFRSVLEPKILGALNLHRLTLNTPLDFFIMYSSGTTVAGNPGQGNYVAANAFLDAFAHYRCSLGLPALTVSWGHIADAGYVAAHKVVSEHLDNIGLKGFSSRQGLTVLGKLLLKNTVHAGVMNIDWRQWARFASSHASPRLSLLLSPDRIDRSVDDGGRVRDLVLAAPEKERSQILQSYLREQVARVLGTSAAKLDPQKPLNEMGLDSLMMVELKNRIEKETGVSLPTVELMRGPNLLTLSRVLLEQLTGKSAAVPAHHEQQIKPTNGSDIEGRRAEELLQKIDQLSDHEVDALLSTLAGDRATAVQVSEKSRK